MNARRLNILALIIGLLLVFGAAIAVWSSSQSASTESDAVTLTMPFNSAAFSFAYPEGWRYTIPRENILLLASPGVLQEQRGATLVIQRSLALTFTTETMQEALDTYLRRGPLRVDRSWEVTDEITETRFGERDALRVGLQGREIEDSEFMRSEITVTRAENGNIFLFAVSAPLADWADQENLLQAILESVEIHE